MGGRRVAGIVAVVLAVAIAAFDFLYYMARHPKRGPVILVVCALLLIFGSAMANSNMCPNFASSRASR